MRGALLAGIAAALSSAGRVRRDGARRRIGGADAVRVALPELLDLHAAAIARRARRADGAAREAVARIPRGDVARGVAAKRRRCGDRRVDTGVVDRPGLRERPHDVAPAARDERPRDEERAAPHGVSPVATMLRTRDAYGRD